VNAVNQNGCTPLHYAATKIRHEIAAVLLEGGIIQMQRTIMKLQQCQR
jgi:ankyrin repeat protein